MNLRNAISNLSTPTPARWAVVPALALAASPAMAQEVMGSITGAICKLLAPFIGPQSTILSLLFLIGLGAMLILWFLNENKEGVLVWLLRAGIAMGVLINLFTVPTLLGLPSPCGY